MLNSQQLGNNTVATETGNIIIIYCKKANVMNRMLNIYVYYVGNTVSLFQYGFLQASPVQKHDTDLFYK